MFQGCFRSILKIYGILNHFHTIIFHSFHSFRQPRNVFQDSRSPDDKRYGVYRRQASRFHRKLESSWNIDQIPTTSEALPHELALRIDDRQQLSKRMNEQTIEQTTKRTITRTIRQMRHMRWMERMRWLKDDCEKFYGCFYNDLGYVSGMF